ncbi:GlsB/YeaQ/YmgE family stress response membrane protein [Nocardioides sp. GY 10127]|uniref:GlsB/YeaQ/YmgE family stress response membrane protein n=1 Tax=Nocardioides sp. GY 10127 TaxID=2569762 RepID=UPI0010A84F58|nr:GlsB/YeaQ/YmgE family stress response membrane protein [Nocardioides sp. GY 10127]TIC82662.1 GlsB/YeaQ/YmgE family stress response membrane protein [Nocardioides sp. GY 10127]
MLIIAIVCFGVLVGGLAQLALGVPFREVSWPTAVAVGLLGSLVGGLLVSLLAGDGLALRPTGLIGSIAGAVLVSLVWQQIQQRRAS